MIARLITNIREGGSFATQALSITNSATVVSGFNEKLNLTDELRVIPLWEHGAPAALGNSDADNPTLTVYLALKPAATQTPPVNDES